jgi:hypothetical protein
MNSLLHDDTHQPRRSMFAALGLQLSNMLALTPLHTACTRNPGQISQLRVAVYSVSQVYNTPTSILTIETLGCEVNTQKNCTMRMKRWRFDARWQHEIEPFGHG